MIWSADTDRDPDSDPGRNDGLPRLLHQIDDR
jgi:hypothetical protein